MATKTSIQWTDISSNPLRVERIDNGKRGWHCNKVSKGCKHCYAEAINKRFGTGLPYTASSAEQIRFVLEKRELQRLLRRRKPAKVFIGDMTDLFQDGVTDEMLDTIWATMALCKHLTFQVLTKRPARMFEYLDELYDYHNSRLIGAAIRVGGDIHHGAQVEDNIGPLPNVWCGTSVEDQNTADIRIPRLLKTPATIRFLSVEPLLGPVGLSRHMNNKHGVRVDCDGNAYPPRADIDWVIIGGESGPRSRPCHLEWIRALVNQCQWAGVSCFVKQLGSHVIAVNDHVADWFDACGHLQLTETERYQGAEGRVFGFRDKKAGDIAEFPPSLLVREFPIHVVPV